MIVSTPVSGGEYFTEREVRQLFAGYRLVGVGVMNERSLSNATRRAMHIADRLHIEAIAAPALCNRLTEEANRLWPTSALFAFASRRTHFRRPGNAWSLRRR